MNKQLVTAIVASLLVLSPALVSAQTVSASETSLIAALTALVQILEQELQQLIALHQGSTQNSPALLTVTPPNGAAPLTVEFHINPSEASAYEISFGDDKTNVETLGDGPGNSCGDPNGSECAHTYTMAGTYTAQIYDVKSEVLATATITVTTSGQYAIPAAPTSGQAPLTTTFTVSIPDNRVYILNFGDGNYTDIGGITSNCPAPGPCSPVALQEVSSQSHTYNSAGTYTATLKDFSGNLFATQTITITNPSAAAPTLTNITPTSGSTNTTVTLYGSNLAGASEVDLYHSNGNLGATVPSTASGISISANSITFTISGGMVGVAGADTYQVKVVTPSGISNAEAFTLTAPSTPSLNESATLDVGSGSYQTGNLSVTGSAVAHSIVVELINSSYSGSTDSNTTSQYLKGGNSYAVENNSGTGDILSNNGRWTVYFNGVSVGSYKVLVYSGDGYSIWPLTTGMLTVSSPVVFTNPNGLPQCPATSAQQRGSMGQTFKCACPAGFAIGTVWGGPSFYSDNSDICTAGAQIGQMNNTTGGEVDYKIAPGQSSYPSWTANAITSQAYGDYWPGSFQIVGPKG